MRHEIALIRAEARLFLLGFLGLVMAALFLFLVPVPVAHAADLILTDGTRASSSQLRDLSNGFGPRASDWTKAPDPYTGNTAGHEGRSGGTFEDRGMGGIAGQIQTNRDGWARLHIQDMADTETGTLKIKANGEWHAVKVEREGDGNWRTLSWRAKQGWHDFKTIWYGERKTGKGTPQDGYSVCKG